MIHAFPVKAFNVRKEQGPSRRVLRDLAVFSLVMASILVMRDGGRASDILKTIITEAMTGLVILFLLITMERLASEERKTLYPQWRLIMRLFAAHAAGMLILALAQGVVMLFPRNASLLGQVFQMGPLLPLHLVPPLASGSFMTSPLHLTDLTVFSLLALLAWHFLMKRKPCHEAWTGRTRLLGMEPSCLQGERKEARESGLLMPLGYFYRYASHE